MNTQPYTDRETEMAQFQAEAQTEEFESLHVADLQTVAVGGPHFWSNMWDNPKPGEFMRYWSWVDNNGDRIGTQLTITAFFGPGCLFENPVDGLAARDTDWPMLSSQMFAVRPGERVRLEMGHRLPSVMHPGVHVLNLLLWELNNYNQPATLLDRVHLRFEVRV